VKIFLHRILCRPIEEVFKQKAISTLNHSASHLLYGYRKTPTIAQGRIIIEYQFKKKGCVNLRLSSMILSGYGQSEHKIDYRV